MIAATTSTTGRRRKAAGWMSDVLVRVLFSNLLPVLLMASTETRLINFRGLPGQRLTGQETFVPARSKIECAVTCKKRSQCSSFLFDAATRTCHLQAVSEPASGYDVQHVYVVHECDDGRYGTFCLNPCSPYCNDACNKLTGECECTPGYMPTMCTQECGNRHWGQNCSNTCSPHCTNICNVVTGECSCNLGYQPTMCVVAATSRLANGPTSREGRVEININGTWGTVCDDGFSTNAAIVACRMMGYETTNASVKDCAYFGQGVGPIHLDDVVCFGIESHLLNCQHLPVGTHNCGHVEYVGVICGL